ncbi:ATP-binding protein [Salinigranum sp. GCM10025319]|uniref:ATP-binding protein n=1 Tax=Salinigranum sp. GCM10025319 TaxID=3252687 RepID=UPI00361D9D1E
MIDSEPVPEPPLCVLHVDDEDARVSTTLHHEQPSLHVRSVASAAAALDRLADADCVVASDDLPDTDGLAFFERVREVEPDLPVVLYGPRDGLVAAAVAAGVTDALRTPTTPEEYTLLGNRVRSFAAQYRATRTADVQERRFRRLVEHSADVVSIVDADGVFRYVSPAATHVFGHDPEDLVGEVGFDYLHPDDLDHTLEAFFEAIGDPSYRPVITFRFAHPEKGWIVLENTGRNLIDDPVVEGFVINSHDVTERVERARELERQRDRLAAFAGVVSHDLRNPLSVAGSTLALLERTGDTAHATDVRRALERMEAIIDDLLTLAREGDDITSLSPVSVPEVADAAWGSVDTESARLSVESRAIVMADPGRLQRLLENLFANAVAHAGPTVHVRVSDVREDATRARGVRTAAEHGTGRDADPSRGFAVSDDGPGIPAADRERVFEYGTSSAAERTGFGLAIVRRVAEAHGWTVTVTESDDGGARFEFRGVRTLDGRSSGSDEFGTGGLDDDTATTD